MKKLLGIILLSLFLFLPAKAIDKNAYQELYNESAHCTVYFKFISRGVERAGNLTEEQKAFVNKMNRLSDISDSNTRFFATELNKDLWPKIKANDIQEKVEALYGDFLDFAGRDYSGTDKLNEKYLVDCNQAVNDRDARVAVWTSDWNGKSRENANGISEYYSSKQNRYISCKAYNREGVDDKYPGQNQVRSDLQLYFLGGSPICDGDIAIDLNGQKIKYDAKSGEWLVIPSFIENFQSFIKSSEKHSKLIIVIILFLISIYLLIKFKGEIKKFTKSKIKFIKENKLRLSATLSVFYLCFMLYLNWARLQGGFFIYEQTYTWFLGWGLLPIVVLWSIYFIWKKK